MKILLAKVFGWMSVLKNSLWISVLMVLMTLVDPNDFLAVVYRVSLKSMEFYIIWSTYASFKLFKGLKRVKRKFQWIVSWFQIKMFRLEKSSKFEIFPQRLHRIWSSWFNDCISFRRSLYPAWKRFRHRCSFHFIARHKLKVLHHREICAKSNEMQSNRWESPKNHHGP